MFQTGRLLIDNDIFYVVLIILCYKVNKRLTKSYGTLFIGKYGNAVTCGNILRENFICRQYEFLVNNIGDFEGYPQKKIGIHRLFIFILLLHVLFLLVYCSCL